MFGWRKKVMRFIIYLDVQAAKKSGLDLTALCGSGRCAATFSIGSLLGL